MFMQPEQRFTSCFTGKPTFDNLDKALAATQVFPEKASALVPGLPKGFDDWLEKLCRFGPAERNRRSGRAGGFDALFAPPPPESSTSESASTPAVALDYTIFNLEHC